MSSNTNDTVATTTTTTTASSWVGAGSLLACAVVTTLCSFVAEGRGREPALRGLVHAGVMLLFAGICIEPIFLARTTNTSERSRILLTDALGMGLTFAGLGMGLLLCTMVGLSIGWVWPNDNHGPQWGEVQEEVESSSSTITATTTSTGAMLLCIATTIVLLGILWVGVWRSLLAPVVYTRTASARRKGDTKSRMTLVLFFLASFVSLFATTSTATTTTTSDKEEWVLLVLDVMAFVFHRAFIGSLLVGGGFGTSDITTTTTMTSCNHHGYYEQQYRRQDLRCRYRFYFCIIACNLGISWLLCSGSSPRNDRNESVWMIMSGGGMILASILQVDEVLSFLRRQRPFLHPELSSPDPPRPGLSRQIQHPQHQQEEFVGYYRCVACFVFYAGTLFLDGVVIDNNNNNKAQTGSWDGCLTRAVHVAAVLAAMVAIFPRLLLLGNHNNGGGHDDGNNANDEKNIAYYGVRIHNNVIVKGVVAFMSTVDVILCGWVLQNQQQQQQTYNEAGDKGKDIKVISLCLRILGAILQAVSFAALERKYPYKATTSIEMSSSSLFTTKSVDSLVITGVSSSCPMPEAADSLRFTGESRRIEDECDNDQGPLLMERNWASNAGNRNNNNTLDMATVDSETVHHRSVDGISALCWLLYLGTHAWHSCVQPAPRGPSTPNGHNVPAAEIQLSKIFHFQVITLGFYSTSIFRQDVMSGHVVTVFSAVEMAGILACQQQNGEYLSWDRIGIFWASMVVLVHTLCQRWMTVREPKDVNYWATIAQDKKEEGAGAVLFPS